MADRYQKFTSGTVGGFAARRLGLPRPEILRRHRPGEPACAGPVLTGGAGRLGKELAAVLEACGAEDPAPAAAPGALVFDATGITDSADLALLYEFFHAHIRTLLPCGRVLILGSPPASATSTREAVTQSAIEGFLRSVGKELRRGATANVAEAVAFLAAPGSGRINGQTLRVCGQSLLGA